MSLYISMNLMQWTSGVIFSLIFSLCHISLRSSSISEIFCLIRRSHLILLPFMAFMDLSNNILSHKLIPLLQKTSFISFFYCIVCYLFFKFDVIVDTNIDIDVMFILMLHGFR